MKEYRKCAKEMLKFIEKSPSCFHAVANIKENLAAKGFVELAESEAWEIVPGQGYYVVRNDSSMIAFRIPQMQLKGFHIVASHSDSPTFKVKESPEIIVEEKYVKLNTEKYGGMILSTWLDRPLSVAGRIVVRKKYDLGSGENSGADRNDEEELKLVTKLVNVDEDLLVIPNVAIHMNRDMNKGVEYNSQVDMLPLFADGMESQGKGALLKKVAKAAGVKVKDILGQDLFLYVRDKGRILGENGDFVFSPRLDDLQCVYASVKAFAESNPREYINVCAVFDNEEVGSGTRQGADSTFLEDVLLRIGEGLKLGFGEFKRLIAGSFLISADNAHAVHPNHPEKADPTNRPYLNNGIVIKYHGSQKYTTDAVSAAKMKRICERAQVPYQTYANRSDIAGGSTLGNISTAHVSVESVDIGLSQLAMHSAVETAGVRDTEYAIKAFAMFYQE
uniref:M18 family aminopeptidase n=1 Tax=Acetatifactor sp. TaxID=1872090 RepID=UPI004056D247